MNEVLVVKVFSFLEFNVIDWMYMVMVLVCDFMVEK